MPWNSAFQTINRHNHDLDIRSVGRLRRVEIVGAVCLSRLDGHCLGIDSAGADLGSTWHGGPGEETSAQENPKQDMPQTPDRLQ